MLPSVSPKETEAEYTARCIETIYKFALSHTAIIEQQEQKKNPAEKAAIKKEKEEL